MTDGRCAIALAIAAGVMLKISPCWGSQAKEAVESNALSDAAWLIGDGYVPLLPLRNIFSTQESAITPAPVKSVIAKKSQSASVSKEPKMQMRKPPQLLGVAIRSQLVRALFFDQADVIVAAPGDRVKDYRIRAIKVDRVDVQDQKTGLNRTIYLK